MLPANSLLSIAMTRGRSEKGEIEVELQKLKEQMQSLLNEVSALRSEVSALRSESISEKK